MKNEYLCSAIKEYRDLLLFLDIKKETTEKQAHSQYDSKLTFYLFW